MSVEVIVPEEFTGEVINDLNIRKGKIEAVDTKRSVKVIHTTVALSQMFGYSTVLRSATQGKAQFTMEFFTYRQVPKGIADELAKKAPEGKENVA